MYSFCPKNVISEIKVPENVKEVGNLFYSQSLLHQWKMAVEDQYNDGGCFADRAKGLLPIPLSNFLAVVSSIDDKIKVVGSVADFSNVPKSMIWVALTSSVPFHDYEVAKSLPDSIIAPMSDDEYRRFFRFCSEHCASFGVHLQISDERLESVYVALCTIGEFARQTKGSRWEALGDLYPWVSAQQGLMSQFTKLLVPYANNHQKMLQFDEDATAGHCGYGFNSTHYVSFPCVAGLDIVEQVVFPNDRLSFNRRPEIMFPLIMAPVSVKAKVQSYVRDLVGFKVKTRLGEVLLAICGAYDCTVDSLFCPQRGIGYLHTDLVHSWFGQAYQDNPILVGQAIDLLPSVENLNAGKRILGVDNPWIVMSPVGEKQLIDCFSLVNQLMTGVGVILHCRQFNCANDKATEVLAELVDYCFQNFTKVMLVNSALGGDGWFFVFTGALGVVRVGKKTNATDLLWGCLGYFNQFRLPEFNKIKQEPLDPWDLTDVLSSFAKNRTKSEKNDRCSVLQEKLRPGYVCRLGKTAILSLPEIEIDLPEVVRRDFVKARDCSNAAKTDKKNFVVQFLDLNCYGRPDHFYTDLGSGSWACVVGIPVLGFISRIHYGNKKTAEKDCYNQLVNDSFGWDVPVYSSHDDIALVLAKILADFKPQTLVEITKAVQRRGYDVDEEYLRVFMDVVFEIDHQGNDFQLNLNHCLNDVEVSSKFYPAKNSVYFNNRTWVANYNPNISGYSELKKFVDPNNSADYVILHFDHDQRSIPGIALKTIQLSGKKPQVGITDLQGALQDSIVCDPSAKLTCVVTDLAAEVTFTTRYGSDHCRVPIVDLTKLVQTYGVDYLEAFKRVMGSRLKFKYSD